jgi:hypothetical protein
MGALVITLGLSGVSPTTQDPNEVFEGLFELRDHQNRPTALFDLDITSEEAEWD